MDAKQYRAEYYRKNKKRAMQLMKEWRKKNPHYARDYYRNKIKPAMEYLKTLTEKGNAQ